MNRIVLAASALAAALLLPGCSRTIDGDVFIVTKGGQSIKLGLVTVKAIKAVPANAAIARFERKASDVNKKADASQAAATAAEESLTRVRSTYVMSPSAETFRAIATAEGASKRASEKWARVSEETATLQSEISAEALLASLPSSDSTTTTDADGKFSIKLPAAEDYILIATATRSIGSEHESYTWVVPAAPRSGTKRVFLSNDNLFRMPR